MLLQNKVILVTGSNTGIGLAIAKACLNQGAKVMLHGLKEETLINQAQALGENCTYIKADLLNSKSYELMVNATVEAFGRIDGLVNNAGIYPRSNIDNSIDVFDKVMTVNAKAPMQLIHYACQHFKSQKCAASIVNIGSINAYCGQPDLLAYSMSKGALMTMTKNLSDALLCQNIRVNQLNVGWTATENEIALKKREGLKGDWQKNLPKHIAPKGKLLSPLDIAPHVVFWLSEYSAPVTGSVYDIEQYPFLGRNRLCDIKIT